MSKKHIKARQDRLHELAEQDHQARCPICRLPRRGDLWWHFCSQACQETQAERDRLQEVRR